MPLQSILEDREFGRQSRRCCTEAAAAAADRQRSSDLVVVVVEEEALDDEDEDDGSWEVAEVAADIAAADLAADKNTWSTVVEEAVVGAVVAVLHRQLHRPHQNALAAVVPEVEVEDIHWALLAAEAPASSATWAYRQGWWTPFHPQLQLQDRW